MNRTVQITLISATLVSLATVLAAGIYWWRFDTAPIFKRNITTVPKLVSGNVIPVGRDVIKLRDCALLQAEHYIESVGENGGHLYQLGTVKNRIVGEGKSGFTLNFAAPPLAPPGHYVHRVDLAYACNPIRETSVTVESNTFFLDR